MKQLVVIGLVALLLLLLYWRLRPLLKLLRNLFHTILHFQQQLAANRAGQASRPGQQGEKLVRCEACGTWVPHRRALAGKSGAIFCSTECLSARKAGKQRATGVRS